MFLIRVNYFFLIITGKFALIIDNIIDNIISRGQSPKNRKNQNLIVILWL